MELAAFMASVIPTQENVDREGNSHPAKTDLLIQGHILGWVSAKQGRREGHILIYIYTNTHVSPSKHIYT